MTNFGRENWLLFVHFRTPLGGISDPIWGVSGPPFGPPQLTTVYYQLTTVSCQLTTVQNALWGPPVADYSAKNALWDLPWLVLSCMSEDQGGQDRFCRVCLRTRVARCTRHVPCGSLPVVRVFGRVCPGRYPRRVPVGVPYPASRS